MKTRLEKLWDFIDEYLEVDYGYLPRSQMDDDACIDEYIQEIKDDFKSMIERGMIKTSSINDIHEILKELDNR